MKSIASAAVVLLLGISAAAQSKNPVADTVRDMLPGRSKNMVAAAEAMPSDKYNYKPTPDQMSFGHLVVHSIESNFGFCSAASGTAAPSAKPSENDGKDKLVADLRQSFDFCQKALANVEDSKLGDEVDLFGHKATRAAALIRLAGSWADHYGAEAMYLRLNGVLPPTAKK